MRVVIMETNGKEAVALSRDGQFVRIRNLGYAVGQEIQITPEMLIRKADAGRARVVTKIATLAACFCILFASVLSFLILNSQSYGYVSVDVNPSIEYRINRFDRVVSVSALNEDGMALLESIGTHRIEGKDIEIALSLTVNELSVQGYLDGQDAGIIISSSAGSTRASTALNQKLKAYAAQEAVLQDVEVFTAIVSTETVEKASQLGTTAGKLHLIQSIAEDVNIQEWIDKSVTEIYDAVKDHSSDLPADPETEIQPPPEVTEEPETTVETDVENATSAPVPDTTDEPITTEENTVVFPETETPTDTEAKTETDTETETESEVEKETEQETEKLTDTETETESETEPEPETETEPETEEESETETETESESETSEEEKTWPETWPETMPDQWPEEWPEPETDESGNTVLPEPENKPWWWFLLAWIFGWN